MSRLLFFFQAEDGIRARVRSRGLGDVYKGQAHDEAGGFAAGETYLPEGMAPPGFYRPVPRGLETVSYTHLTLPTIYSV